MVSTLLSTVAERPHWYNPDSARRWRQGKPLQPRHRHPHHRRAACRQEGFTTLPNRIAVLLAVATLLFPPASSSVPLLTKGLYAARQVPLATTPTVKILLRTC